MKKFLAVVVATLVAVSALATFIPSFAAFVPAGEDLLAESGLGDPEFIAEEGIAVNGATWLGHESWNMNQGWDGFKGTDNISTAEVVETPLSGGSEGYALRFANDNEGASGAQFGIENIDKICDFEEGKSYIAKAIVKVSGDHCNGHNSFIGFNCGECTLHGGNGTDIAHTGEWQVVYSTVFEYVEENLTSDGAGAYLSICFGENWISSGYEMLIEKVEVFEVEDDGEILNFVPAVSCMAGDTWSVSDGQFCAPLQCPDLGTAGEAKDAQGQRVYPTKEIITTTLPDGTEGPAARFAVDAVEGYVNFGNYYGLGGAGLQPQTTYTAVIQYKFSGNTRAANVLGYGETKTNLVAGSEWHSASITFTTGDTIDNLCIGPDGFVAEAEAGYELILGSMKLYEGSNAPTGDNGLIAVAAVAVALLATVVFTKKKVSER